MNESFGYTYTPPHLYIHIHIISFIYTYTYTYRLFVCEDRLFMMQRTLYTPLFLKCKIPRTGLQAACAVDANGVYVALHFIYFTLYICHSTFCVFYILTIYT